MNPIYACALAAATIACVSAGSAEFVQQARLADLLSASDATTGDLFATSLALNGGTLVVGAPGDDVGLGADQGSAYVFVLAGSSWQLQAKLAADDGAAGDGFGRAVAASGDTVVIGAQTAKIGAASGQGAAYVFVRRGATWSQQAKLTAPDGQPFDNFGAAVGVSGDTAVVGAPNDNTPPGFAQGSAHVFTRSSASWSHQAKLFPADAADFDNAGNAVAVSGDTVVVGVARADLPGGGFEHGAAYVFVRDGAVWTQQAKLTAADAASLDFFANAVAIDGDTALVGCAAADLPGGADQGAAYAFVRSGMTWSQQIKLTAADAAPQDNFGQSVSILGDRAAVGALRADAPGGVDQGALYVFERKGASWTQEARLVAGDLQTGARLGTGAAIDGAVAAAGAPLHDGAVGANQGAAYVFGFEDRGWSQTAKLGAPEGDLSPGDRFGSAVAIDGDTAVVGVVGDDFGAGFDQGSAYVMVRSGGDWEVQARLLADDLAIYSTTQFGASVALDADTAVIGAPTGEDPVLHNVGLAYVFVRDGAAWTQQARLIAPMAAIDDWFGRSVAVSGDTLLIGSHLDDTGTVSQHGSAYVFVRSGAVWTLQQKLLAGDLAPGERFGFSVALDGDTALIGAFAADLPGGVDQGAAYVFTRSGAVWTQQAKLAAPDAAPGDAFGSAVALDGDTALIGAPNDGFGGGAQQGSAHVFTRSGAVWLHQAKLTAADAADGDVFGSAVALVGDAATVGAPGAGPAGGVKTGAAYVFLRSGSRWIQTRKLAADALAPGDAFGASLAFDGKAILAGAPGTDREGADEGQAYLFATPCPGDVDGDGDVDQSDLGVLLANYGLAVPPGTGGDLDGDGDVDQSDLGELLAHYGGSCP